MAVLGFYCCVGFSLAAVSGVYSSLQCAGFSLQWLLLLQSMGSIVNGAQSQLLRGMWNLPRPGIEPMPPALAGRFFTTEPPGKLYYRSDYTYPSISPWL